MNQHVLEKYIFNEIFNNHKLKIRIKKLKYIIKIKDQELDNINRKYWNLKFLLYIILILFCVYIIYVLV